MDVKTLRANLLIGLAAALPLLELYCARTVYRWRADLYNDSGFMIGLGMAFFALCVLFRGMGELRLNKPMLLANTLLMVAAIYARWNIPPHGPILHVEWIGALWLLLVTTGLCVFTTPLRLYEHFRANMPVIYMLGAVYFAELLYYMMRRVYWFNQEVWFGFLAGKVTSVVRGLLNLMQYDLLPVARDNVIHHQDLKIWINAACSGLEGVVFFCCAFAAMMMLDYRTIALRKIVIGFVAGAALMLALNIIRITMFFMFGVWATQRWGDIEGTRLTVDLFHNNVGWILYTLGMVAFFVWFYRYADKKTTAAG